MKLLDNLFEIVERSDTSSGFSVTIQIASNHIVYKGHFPGYPVTPGVVFIQIIHELLELHLKKAIRLIEISNCKFLKIVNPEKETNAVISADLVWRDELLHVKASGKNNTGSFFKLHAIYMSPPNP
jgi:3-hydroxyacyl-[acyl-carrier-protein] dehydratase